MYEFVLTDRVDNIGYITLNRPEKLNAMPRKMYQEISAALKELDADKSVRVIIIKGAGRAFTAGADLGLMHGTLAAEPFHWEPYRPERFDMGLQVSKPTIAAIHGYCLAGGFELAVSCDIRIASDDAVFGAPEVRWGVLHGFGALMLHKLTARGNIMEMLLTGDRISADEASRLGLVNRVVPRADLEAAANDLAKRIARNGPIAVRMTKELVLRAGEMSLQDGLRIYREYNRLVHLSEDSQEGSEAWAERREAVYADR
jgi:enoyl-CoA hydratase/carnithine racemase